MSRVQTIFDAYRTVARRRGLPFSAANWTSWGGSMKADLARFELRRLLRRAGLGTPELRERWIKEMT